MKKLTALLASATMALSLVGCSTGKTYTVKHLVMTRKTQLKLL